MRVIVTGGAGYIGGQTVLAMLDAGHSVLAIDRSLEKNHLIDSGAKWLVADFAGEVALRAIETFEPDAGDQEPPDVAAEEIVILALPPLVTTTSLVPN